MVKVNETYIGNESIYKIGNYFLKFLKPQNERELEEEYYSKYEVTIKIEFFQRKKEISKEDIENQIAELWIAQISECFNMTSSYIFSWRIKEMEVEIE